MLVLRGLYRESDVTCKSELRVNGRTFNIICEMLRDIGGLSGTKNMSLQEIVAMFLYTLAHHKKNRSIGQYFFRSGETVSRQFHCCLRAFLKLHEVLLYNPTPISDDCEDERWKSFKGHYMGLTLMYMCFHKNDQSSAHDMRVLRNALSRSNGFRVPRGNYYLVDAGYTNCEGFLAPYRGQRYHLKEWTDQQPESAEEFYNMKHARARNVIERCFGLLKGRWKNSCLRSDDINEDELNESDDDSESDSDDEREFITSVATSDHWTNFRNELAQDMFMIGGREMEASQAKGEASNRGRGFGWDAEKKLLQVDKAVYDEWVKTHKKAKGLFRVPFIHYETLAEIYAKDKATGDSSESFVDAIEEMDQEIDKHHSMSRVMKKMM
uniref:Transposase n=1 Tax=Chenopodium quinoa TaxID=63459 RepID=A0A803KUB8_CHEQI